MMRMLDPLARATPHRVCTVLETRQTIISNCLTLLISSGRLDLALAAATDLRYFLIGSNLLYAGQWADKSFHSWYEETRSGRGRRSLKKGKYGKGTPP